MSELPWKSFVVRLSAALSTMHFLFASLARADPVLEPIQPSAYAPVSTQGLSGAGIAGIACGSLLGLVLTISVALIVNAPRKAVDENGDTSRTEGFTTDSENGEEEEEEDQV